MVDMAVLDEIATRCQRLPVSAITNDSLRAELRKIATHDAVLASMKRYPAIRTILKPTAEESDVSRMPDSRKR